MLLCRAGDVAVVKYISEHRVDLKDGFTFEDDFNNSST